MADVAVPLNDFAFIERLWRDWSPGWDIPLAELASVKATLGQPGVLAAALSYYRQTFNPLPNVPQSSTGRGPQQIQVPTLYIHGRDDGCIGVEAFFDNGLQIVIVDGAGHFVHQEKPGEVNRMILEFLE